MPEYVYVMSNASYAGWVKVGFSTRTPEERRKVLSTTTGVLSNFEIEYVFEARDGQGSNGERTKSVVNGRVLLAWKSTRL